MKINNLGIFQDAKGNQYELLEKVTQVVSRTVSGPPKTLDGRKSYVTACGIPVNVENEKYVTWDDVVLTPVK